MKPILLAAIAALTATTAFAADLTGTVTHVRDGDTIEVNQVPIRLDGVAAPERKERGGSAATAYMKQLVDGKKVSCTLSGPKSHDRYVGICYLNGEDIGALIIGAGLARDCPRYSKGRYKQYETKESVTLPFPRYCR